jgi:hypothetical protein
MIAALSGILSSKTPQEAIISVQGVGYQVFIALSTFFTLPDINSSVQVFVSTHVRNDTIQLFGFATLEEKQAFSLLTTISGVGPKLALSALSTLSVPDLCTAIEKRGEKISQPNRAGIKRQNPSHYDFRVSEILNFPDRTYQLSARRSLLRTHQFGVPCPRSQKSHQSRHSQNERNLRTGRPHPHNPQRTRQRLKGGVSPVPQRCLAPTVH